MKRFLLFLISFSLLPGLYAEVRVVTTLPVYAQLAAMVGGNHVRAESIGLPGQDPHFVRPKPSYALKVRKADLFVTTGLDLELWVPALLEIGRAHV